MKVPESSIRFSPMQSRTLAKVKLYMGAYMIMGQICYSLCRINIGFAQLTMSKELGLKAETFGFAVGFFAVGAFLMQLPAGLAFEKFGPRRWMTFIMVGWGLLSLSQAFVHTPTQLIVLRFLIGAFEAGSNPGMVLLVSIWFRGRDQGVGQSFAMIGLGISGIIGSPLNGWLLGTHMFGLSGWRTLFLLNGTATVVWAVMGLLLVYDDPAKTRWLKPDERAFMSQYLEEYQAAKKAHGALDSTIWQALKDFRILCLVLSFACCGWIAATFAFFSPSLLKAVRAGTSNQYVGFLVAGPYLVILVSSFLWGRHADKTGERHWHCVLPLLVGAGGLLLFPVSHTVVVAMLCLCLVQAGNSCYTVNFWPSANMVVGRNTIAKTTAIIHLGNYVGQFIAPVFFGWTTDITGNSKMGLYTCSGLFLANFFIMQAFWHRHKSEERKRPMTIEQGIVSAAN